ncbi:ankyrin and HET domain-containing protein, partial [Colletotrichum musicola]
MPVAVSLSFLTAYPLCIALRPLDLGSSRDGWFIRLLGFCGEKETGLHTPGPTPPDIPQETPVVDPGPNEFRLLHVHPASSLNSPLAAHLSVARYDPDTRTSSTPYDALSYRWGDPDDLVAILVNGMEVSITRSLDSALRHLRNRDGELVIWTDAVCIAQSHRAERSAQICLMGGIYRAARVVRMYLGEAGAHTSAAASLGRPVYLRARWLSKQSACVL